MAKAVTFRAVFTGSRLRARLLGCVLPLGFLAIDPFLPPSSLAVCALLALLLFRRWGQPLAILSADVERAAAPMDADVGPLTLERERAGAVLARRTGLPVLVTGGLVTAPPPVGQMMAASMAADFGVPVRWTEDRSATTWENASFSAPMLRQAGISRVYLVTHAWHMRRALLAFRRAGIDAVPAPVRMDPGPRWTLGELVPRTSAWERSFFALHEWLGLLFYMVRS